MIHGGTAVNVIPEIVAIHGTVRTFEQEVRDFIENRIEEIVRGVTQAARASYKIEYRRIMPPVDNDLHLAAKVHKILTGSFPSDMVINQFEPQMGCEEFSLFQEKVPGLFLFIGNDKEGNEVVPLHDPGYIFNDEILTIGVKALCAVALGYSDHME
jgi:metal-dependent amidase/aminoacylase/carboxypeptidase family protein